MKLRPFFKNILSSNNIGRLICKRVSSTIFLHIKFKEKSFLRKNHFPTIK